MVLLSIDWDFMVPERGEWDIGHQESPLFLDMLWAHRYHLRDKMLTSGDEADFWHHVYANLKFQRDIVPYLSDSHAYGYQAAQGCEGVFLFDAHHDCWDTQKGDQVHCDNWLRVWLEEVPTRWAVWVYPEHAKWQGAPNFPEDMQGRLDAVSWETFKNSPSLVPRHEAIGAIHICRSGCWTPPWLDKAFIEFIADPVDAVNDAVVMQDGAWNPIKPRWDAEKEAQAKSVQEQIEEMMGQMKVVKGATSETFRNGRVEVSIPESKEVGE